MVNLGEELSSGHILGIDRRVPFPPYKFTLKYTRILRIVFHAEGCISPILVNIYDENKDEMYCLEIKISISHIQFVCCALVQPQSK